MPSGHVEARRAGTPEASSIDDFVVNAAVLGEMDRESTCGEVRDAEEFLSRSRPRVLVFKETLLPASETFILAQMRALSRYSAVLAGLERTRPSLPLPAESIVLRDGVGRFPALHAKVYRRLAIAPLFHRRAARARPDLVHAHFASGGRTAVALARRLGVPLIVTVHGADVTVRGTKDAYKELATEAQLFLCVSSFIRDRAIDAGLPASRCVVHHIGIDREQFRRSAADQSARGVLFVGRLVEKKGCEYLIRAMRLVQKELPDAELRIIGDGPLRTSLEALATALAVRCTFSGSRPTAEVREALQGSRVFCAPSVTAANGDSEGLPTVIAEAHAMSVPVVATRHAGIPEMVLDGVNGLLTTERDEEALAHALLLLLADGELWQRCSEAARKRIAQHFDLRRQTGHLEGLYDGVLASA